jgi:hypothetical protein
MPGYITEPECCIAVIGAVDPSLCNPSVAAAQVQRLFVTLLDGAENFDEYTTESGVNVTTRVNSPAAWSNRMNQDAEGSGAIITLHCIGDKPLPEDEEQELPLGQTRVLDRNHTLNATVLESSDKINMLMRKWALYGATIGLWYETSAPKLFGSGTAIHIPIRASIKPGMVIPRERSGVQVWELTITWKDLRLEDQIASPVPSTPEAVCGESGSGSGSGSGA